MKIAYLVNQYPMASLSFIRREIAALTAAGVEIERFGIRQWPHKLVDPADIAEFNITRVVLDQGAVKLAAATLGTLFTRPGRFFKALKLAMRCGRHSDRGMLVHLVYFAEACLLRRWFAESGIEHVHSHFGSNSTTAAMVVRELGGPAYSFTTHGPEEFDKPDFIKLGPKVERAAFAVAVSEYGRSQIYRWCSYESWSKVHVVHCGVDASFLSTPATPIDPASRKLVCIGRLTEQKGQQLLVEAAARLHAQGEAFELVLVGDGEMRPEIERLIAKHGLQDKVKLAGWMTNEQVCGELLQSRAMVLPSFAEGLPVVIMEALALRRPVISTYVAGIPELVEPGQCGWLVPAGAVEPLAEAMRAALRADVSTLSAMGDAGHARVAAGHDATVEAGKLLELIKGVRTSGAREFCTTVPGTAAVQSC